MKTTEKIKALSDRIDQMNLRERGMIFAAAALIVVTLINSLFLDPLLAQQKHWSGQVVQQQEQMKAIRAQIEALVQSKNQDPNASNRARLAQIKQQLAEIEAFLQGKQDRLIPPDQMTGLLQQILQHNRRLQLLSLQTLSATTLIDEAKPAEGNDRTVADRLVYKHGVEITVRGGYLDLMNYLAELEKLPWQMFWGKASLNVEVYPAATLTLTLYTLSLDKTWLTV